MCVFPSQTLTLVDIDTENSKLLHCLLHIVTSKPDEMKEKLHARLNEKIVWNVLGIFSWSDKLSLYIVCRTLLILSANVFFCRLAGFIMFIPQIHVYGYNNNSRIHMHIRCQWHLYFSEKKLSGIHYDRNSMMTPNTA